MARLLTQVRKVPELFVIPFMPADGIYILDIIIILLDVVCGNSDGGFVRISITLV